MDLSVSQRENLKQSPMENYNYHSRNILWVDYEESNSSWNSTEQLMCPMYINVSESIRLVKIITFKLRYLEQMRSK